MSKATGAIQTDSYALSNQFYEYEFEYTGDEPDKAAFLSARDVLLASLFCGIVYTQNSVCALNTKLTARKMTTIRQQLTALGFECATPLSCVESSGQHMSMMVSAAISETTVTHGWRRSLCGTVLGPVRPGITRAPSISWSTLPDGVGQVRVMAEALIARYTTPSRLVPGEAVVVTPIGPCILVGKAPAPATEWAAVHYTTVDPDSPAYTVRMSSGPLAVPMSALLSSVGETTARPTAEARDRTLAAWSQILTAVGVGAAALLVPAPSSPAPSPATGFVSVSGLTAGQAGQGRGRRGTVVDDLSDLVRYTVRGDPTEGSILGSTDNDPTPTPTPRRPITNAADLLKSAGMQDRLKAARDRRVAAKEVERVKERQRKREATKIEKEKEGEKEEEMVDDKMVDKGQGETARATPRPTPRAKPNQAQLLVDALKNRSRTPTRPNVKTPTLKRTPPTRTPTLPANNTPVATAPVSRAGSTSTPLLVSLPGTKSGIRSGIRAGVRTPKTPTVKVAAKVTPKAATKPKPTPVKAPAPTPTPPKAKPLRSALKVTPPNPTPTPTTVTPPKEPSRRVGFATPVLKATPNPNPNPVAPVPDADLVGRFGRGLKGGSKAVLAHHLAGLKERHTW